MPAPITTPRLRLREITLADLNDIHRLHAIPEVDEFNTLGLPKDISETRKLVKRLLDSGSRIPRESYTWKIMLCDCDVLIGMAGLTPSNDKFRLGEIYYKFHPEFWGMGFATEVAKALIRFGFNRLKLHKVEAGVATGNKRSIRVLEKCGMTREGLRRKILPIRGEWVDNYHYAIVEDDPRP
ncbi:MAG: GNAT family N-acetyltransferase [Bacteroidales bacterium]|nr:GNAT family N-acetyltransferase [Bacteroidales bacterium]